MVKKIALILFLFSLSAFAQEGIDVFVIDSYVTSETPHEIRITFFTSDSVKSKIEFKGENEFIVSNEFIEEHKFQLPLAKLNYDSNSIPFKIIVEERNGKISYSDVYDLYLSGDYNLEIKINSNMFDLCLGGLIYLLPMPSYFINGNEGNFVLTKEFPVVAFYNHGYNYPSGYFAIEYSYVFNQDYQNYLRVGYKQIFQTDVIKYISPGINLTTNFNGFNGISPEINFGFFKFYETFTFYGRYRFNFKPYLNFENFHEISIGLFTSSISFNF